MSKMRKTILASALLCTGAALGDVDLNGAWRLDYFPQPDDGAVRTLPLSEGLGVKTVTAEVPGNCELDLVRAGILPAPEIGLNILKLRPYEGYQWLYTRTFAAPPVAKGGRAMLRSTLEMFADLNCNMVRQDFMTGCSVFPQTDAYAKATEEEVLDMWRERNIGWALWNLSGTFGVLDSQRTDITYEKFRGHLLDRKMLELLRNS